MIKAIQVEYKEDSVFKGHTKEGTEKYNKQQLEGLELYKRCNFEKELKRNKDKFIEEYTKLFLAKDGYLMTVLSMKNHYPHGYYTHCKEHTIFVDHDNKCLLLVK